MRHKTPPAFWQEIKLGLWTSGWAHLACNETSKLLWLSSPVAVRHLMLLKSRAPILTHSWGHQSWTGAAQSLCDTPSITLRTTIWLYRTVSVMFYHNVSGLVACFVLLEPISGRILRSVATVEDARKKGCKYFLQYLGTWMRWINLTHGLKYQMLSPELKESALFFESSMGKV